MKNTKQWRLSGGMLLTTGELIATLETLYELAILNGEANETLTKLEQRIQNARSYASKEA